MLNIVFRSWLISVFMAAAAVIVAAGIAMGANVSTILILLALGMAPVIVTMVLANSASPPNVAEVLHAVDTKDDRRPPSAQERLASLCSE